MGLHTKIKSQGIVSISAAEVYGSGQVILRLGNGGAGATGLIRHICEAYLIARPGQCIEWVCNHSRNTQLALLQGAIDIGFTYEREEESRAALEGWSMSHGCAFHDHFILAGPASDPARVSESTGLADAFQRIYDTKSPFHSRIDSSATMWKEQSLWGLIGRKPWEEESALATWFKSTHFGPADALTEADRAGAYLLSDRSTILAQTRKGTIFATTVFYEPTTASDVLLNSCYMVTVPNPSSDREQPIKDFISFVKSGHCQQLIADFGKGQVGYPLFASAEAKYARETLKGGFPQHSRWFSILNKRRQE